MKEKRLTHSQGKGSISHNNREFTAKNVDEKRTADNVTFVCQPIGEAYEQLFAESTERYNTKQKRNDRKIKNGYFEHLFGCKPSNMVKTSGDKRKSFYEDIVQIGKMDDSGFETNDWELVAECLKEYMRNFQERNPNFYVFNAVLHMDEATPHLHINYIPIGHYKRGQDIQNGIAQALKEMGFGEGKNAISRWRESEVEVLNRICRGHGIEPLPPEKSRGTLTVEKYKEQIHKADELSEQNKQAETQLKETKAVLETAEKKKVKLFAIDDIPVKNSLMKTKVTISKEDYDNLTSLAKKYVVSAHDTKKLKSQNAELLEKVANLETMIVEKDKALEKYTHPTISMSVIKAEQKKINETDRLKRNLEKAMALIDSYGLRETYDKFHYTHRSGNVLE